MPDHRTSCFALELESTARTGSSPLSALVVLSLGGKRCLQPNRTVWQWRIVARHLLILEATPLRSPFTRYKEHGIMTSAKAQIHHLVHFLCKAAWRHLDRLTSYGSVDMATSQDTSKSLIQT